MIFFDNCYSCSGDKQPLSISRQLGRFFRPPNFIRYLLVVLLLSLSVGVFAMQVTLNLKSVPLEMAFAEIKKQTGYGFWYEKKDLADLSRVTIDVKNADLVTVLEACLKGQPLTYQVFDKTVVVKRKAALPSAVPVKKVLQEKVRGKVVDAQTREPLAGVLLKVKSTLISVVSNDKGEFELTLASGKYDLVVQYLGYHIRELAIQLPRREELLIFMSAAENVLQEVKFNAGYYQVRDRERTGSIARVSAETIQKQPINNPLQALQGRVAGLEVTQLTGVPGGGFKVQVRGRNSIASGGDPLYIIDGVIFPSTRINTANANTITQDASPLGMLNPSDIESIEVLKDADATAIYGSRGANGVILLTTTKAKSETVKVNLSLQQGMAQVGNFVSMMDTEQYLAMRMKAFANDGLVPAANDFDINGVWDKTKNTDWQKVLIGGNAGVRNISASVSGGSKKATYLLGANHSREGTVYEGDFGLVRNGVNFNLNLGGAGDRFTAVVSGSYHMAVSNLMTTDPTTYITMAPNAPDVFDGFGKLNWKYKGTDILFNPMAALNHTIDASTNNLLGNVSLNYRIIEGLVFKSSLGYNSLGREELAKRPNSSRVPATNPTAANRESQFGNNRFSSWIVEPQLNYASTIGSGRLSAILGMSFQDSKTEYRNILASNFNSDDLMDNMASASVFTIRESTFTSYRYAALFSRLNYSLSDRYFLNLTARRDGSSRFGPGKQFANFWAIGTAWIFSEEKAIAELLPFMNLGKLRGSYGVTGNDQIPDYGYMQLYNNSGTYQGIPTLNIGRIANPNYAWETNWKAEMALELGFFRDRLNLQLAYFSNRSTNQLAGLALPPSVGSSSIQANLPATVSNTGLELEGRLRLIDRKLWKWSAAFNCTLPKNKLLSYPGIERSANATNYIVGRPLAINRYYDTYVDPNTGLYAFRDYNNNGLRDDVDRYLNVFMGQQYFGGMQHTLGYGRFNLDVHFSFVKQRGRSLLNGIGLPMGYFTPAVPYANVPSVFVDNWSAVGDVSEVPKYTTLVGGLTNLSLGKSMGAQSIADASFIRLRNVSLTYSLPDKWLNWGRINSLQVGIQAQNLFTITGYKGLDPENQLFNRLPPLRTILFSVRTNF
ncbi:SusC/RagA family TonB-linked outer membrane protein [Pedobacter ureilyticus]|uniref:SusC/RagA family TonB-linked outer membrane protein n=1 Tax=Pedobacter ureilyticus TaxID=1393051 RepID=A0ABW9J9K8_9SPHI|nr:SusC/RagA family TonB-linked outer membrane protein [Pedobacter helvus]